MSKKKAGSYNTPNIKASNLLPQVFNTDVNKKWLDSTLDQMISKGNLKNIEGYIGDQSGKNRNADDVYTSKQKLSPAIAVKDKNKKLVDTITPDDIANSVNINFSEYNYSSANATKKYSYRPPINVNKFINYTNYAWVDQMPTYESVRTLNTATVDAANPSIPTGPSLPLTPSNGDYFALTIGSTTETYMFDGGVNKWQVSKTTNSMYSNNENNEGYTTVINPVALSTNQLEYLIEDNNNTFKLADQMLIKFVGDGWHNDAHQYTYLVTGTGNGIKLVPWYNWSYNIQTYPDITRTTITVGGIWDKSTITIVGPNKESSLWNEVIPNTLPSYRTHFGTMMDYYNSDASRLPIFDGFIFSDAESNKTQFIEDRLVVFGRVDVKNPNEPNDKDFGNWVEDDKSNTLDPIEYYRIYYTNRNSTTGDVSVTKLVDAEFIWNGPVANAGQFTIGKLYKILSSGDTDFTLAGAANNSVGTEFIAKSSGSGTGTANTVSEIRQFVVQGTPEEVLAKYKHQLVGFDKVNYDRSTNIVSAKDYIVLETDSPFRTAWSRNNKWTDINTLKKVDELIFGGIGLKTFIESNKLAKRPIIEFDGKMNLFNWADVKDDNQWLGIADFAIKPTGDYEVEKIGTTIKFKYPDKVEVNPSASTRVIFTEGEYTDQVFLCSLNGSNKELTPTNNLEINDGMYVRNALPDSIDRQWTNSDVWFNGAVWKTGQQRIDNNQMPLFKLFNPEGTAIETLDGAVFKGSRVFNYKLGSGHVDKELNHALSYKDVNGMAEYQFENYLFTEDHFQNVKSIADGNVTHRRSISNQYFFKNNNKLSTLYKQSEDIAGAETLLTTDVTSVKADLEIAVGHNAWRTTRIIQLHQADKECVVTELQNGVYLDKTNVNHTNIYVGRNMPVVFNNLLEAGDIKFKSVAGVDLEPTLGGLAPPVPGVSIDRAGNDIIVNITTYNEKIIIKPDDATLTNSYTIIPLDDYDEIDHTVEINGVHLSADQYDVSADTITIPKELIKVNDIVDVRYTNNDNDNRATNVAIPNTLKHNANNELIKDFTPSETISHWQSIISSTPGLKGNIYSTNNYEAINTHTVFGGNLFIYKDLSVIHDALYASDQVDITNTLISAGEEWDNFKNRFSSQVSRLYATKPYSSVRALVDEALKSITVIRKGGDLYSTSNMVYFEKAKAQKLIIDNDTAYPTLKLKDNIHSDDNIQDHVYVYITELDGTVLSTRLAVKDIDYYQIGNTVTFTYQPVGTANDYPYVEVYYHQMDSQSNVPPSLTKLRLAPAHIPTFVSGTLIGHDFAIKNGTTDAVINDMTSEKFDVVLSALFDLEKRIYAGLVKGDNINSDNENINYGFTSMFMPNKSRQTWYTLDVVNNALYKHFKRWKAKYQAKEVTLYDYDAADKKTWNWSTSAVDGHFKTNKLPGHWTGAYEVLFGTQTPHLTPWHMLGYAFKPTWWDSTYSWTDATKRAALISALKRGLVSTGRQDTEWANHMWDWNTKCPVKTDGSPEDLEIVLGSITSLNASQEFVFGDWAGLEGKWRNTSAGKAALIDVLLKLNPTKAFGKFYVPGTARLEKHLDFLDRDNNINTPASNLIPSKVYKRVVSDFTIESVDQFERNTFIRLVGPQGGIDAIVTPNFVGKLNLSYLNGASISSRGRNLTSTPAVYTNFTQKQIDTSAVTYKTKEVQHVSSGIAQALYNFITHNNINYSIDNLHNNIDVHLATRINGFSSKHLLDFKTDTFDTTNHTLSENDFELGMYKSTPINIAIASSITIEKTNQGWQITGAGYGKQEFAFFEPDNTNSSSYTNVKVGTYEVKNYNNFAPTHSVIDYETTLGKIQDTYSFIRGYYAYLESVGFIFPYSGDSVALSFVKWALSSNTADTKTFDLGTNLKFSPLHGNILELNTGIHKENTVAKLDSTGIDISNLIIDRVDNVLSIETVDNIIIGSVGFVVVEYDHIALLNDKTTFGVVVHDSVKNISQDKISFRGLITSDWTGHKRAPGYLVFDNKIVENYDSSVQAIDDYYRTDGIDFNPAITKLEDITIGNSNKNLAIYGKEFDAISKRNYFQGLIKESGTAGNVNKISRKFATNNLDVSINEQYMLSRSYFGNTDRLNSVEFTIENNPIQASVQAIKFSDYVLGETTYDDVLLYKHDDKRFVNPFKDNSADKFTTRDITNVDSVSLTAGAVLDAEAKYKAGSTSELSSLYNELEDYATIPAWVNTKSYKLKDRVRNQGRLLECAVASTTITRVSDNIEVRGIAVNPRFTHGTVATIDGISTTFAEFVTKNDDIELISTVTNPTVDPDALVGGLSPTFLIDDESISFSNLQEVPVVKGPASVTGNVIDPIFSNVAGKSISISTANSSTTIDFDITPNDEIENFTGINNGVTPNNKTENFTGTNNAPSDVVENIAGVSAQQTYTISQALSPSTYSISTVTVDGSSYAETTDWTISGQDITFVNPVFAGSESIVITLTHVDDLEDTFTIAETLSSSTWSVAQVTVDGTIVSNYNVTGQNLVFTSGPTDGDPIIVTLTHVNVVDLEDTFTIAQDIINTPYFVETVTVSGTSTTAFTLSGQDLIFNAGSEPTEGQPIVVTVAHTSVSMTTAEIVAKINSELTAGGVNTTEPAAATPYVGNDAIRADLNPDVDPPNSRLRIQHWATDINSDLVITGDAIIMTDELGFTAATVTASPDQRLENQQQILDITGIRDQINAEPGLPHITASIDNNKIKLTSSSDGSKSTLIVSGNLAPSIMGTALSQSASQIPVPVTTSMVDAVILINQSLVGHAGVSLTTSGGVVNIISTNETLVLAGQDDSFLLQAGISEFGTVNKVTDDTISNSIIAAEWIDISHKDPALFNVWVANDSDYTVDSINTIKTKFFGWNVFQMQNNGLYPTDTAECPICAGATTADGNDAQITTNVSHNLAVGDYIMLLNTTTVPNIDGIHRVTKVEGSDKFYIDEYIDRCGNASSIMLLRSTRFDTIEDRTAALETTNWNLPPGSNVWTDRNTNGDISVNVFSLDYPVTGGPALSGTGYKDGYLKLHKDLDPYALTPIRSATKVITNTDLDNITIYDYDSNTPILDLELYDPMRGIIPGVADAEIDVKSVHDVAIYNTATEETYEADDDNAWAEEEVGRRWWDTSRVKFYDYDQGDINDKATNWGKQFVDSEIVIWEWTKSTVAPDDYEQAVSSNKVMFGTPASGTAYAEFDAIKNQNEYYYTLQTVWNKETATYDNVYYFWVRNKETIGSKNKNIITSEVENIIADPSANGIYWFSIIDNDAIILSDIWNFINKKVVVQLNKKLTSNNHQNWVLLSKDSDIVPDYWYTGLVNNLAAQDQNELRLPDFNKHPYARYGDDRANRQAWFDDVSTARKTAIDIINRLLVPVNIYDETKNRFLSAVEKLKLSDDTWDWTDYITEEHSSESTYLTNVETVEQLEALDVSNYETAKIEIINDDDVDRSEFYTYTVKDGWKLTKKRNATVKWSELRLGKSYAWDMEAWDSTPWSNTSITEWWIGIIELLRDTVFVGNHQSKFNKFFFGIVDYAMSRNLQVDWAMKTSYIRLNISSELVQQKKYKKDNVATIEGYVNEVKPFHVKISETNRNFTHLDETKLQLTELSHNKVITIKHDNNGANFEGLIVDANESLTKSIVLENKGTTAKRYTILEKDAILETHANQDDGEWDITSVTDNTGTLTVDVDYYQIDQVLMFTVPPTGDITVSLEFRNDIILQGGDGSTIYTDVDGLDGAGIIDGGTALQSDLYNTANNNEVERSTEAHLRPQEVVSIFVQTNRAGSTDDTETRTFAYIKDVYHQEHVFALQESKSTTTSAEISITSNDISVTTASNLAGAEYILVNDEVMHVAVNGSTISILNRAVNGTFEHNHATGSRITDITDVAASYTDPAIDSLSVKDRRFNDVGTTLLDSTTTDEAILLNNTGKGIVL